MNSPPEPPPLALGRRLIFLGLCLCGFLLLIAGWRAANRADEKAPRNPVIILVSPFTNSSPNVDGTQLSNRVVSELSKTEGLRVLTDGGQKVKVNAVLSGTIIQTGERIRIKAQLIDRATGYHVWEHTYDREAKDASAVASEIATGILKALRGQRD